MPPLFPYQAVVPQSQGDQLGGYAPQLSAPPYNEILDSLLTGYLWACLLVALFLAIYFAISFCVWAIGAALATIDMIIDCVQLHGSCPDAGTDAAMAASASPNKYNTACLKRIFPRNENGNLTWSRDKSDKDLREVRLHTEDQTTRVKNRHDRCQRGEPVCQPNRHSSLDSEETNAVDSFSNTTYALNSCNQVAVSKQH